MASVDRFILKPCQRRFIMDPAPLCMWLATRQAAGKSFAMTLKHVIRRLRKKGLSAILSASERQSREDMEKVYSHLRVLGAMSEDALRAESMGKTECRLDNGSRIISLPASPDTIRGFSGDVGLDEFGHHKDSREIWKSIFPTITRGFCIDIVFTPNGKQNMAYELWEHNEDFSKHKTTIYDAVAEGADVDIEKLRAGISDADAWAQEFECQFIDEATALIPYELIALCEHDNAETNVDLPEGAELYLGMDIGRKKDLTVIWIVEKLGDVLWTRAVKIMERAPFAAQREALFDLLKQSTRACIDATGLGMQLAEEAQDAFGEYRVEAVNFSAKVKEQLAFGLRRQMEDRLIRLPKDKNIREDFHSVRKTTTAAGNYRFDAEKTDLGHADRFWAAALCCHAAAQGGQIVFPRPVSIPRKNASLWEGY